MTATQPQSMNKNTKGTDQWHEKKYSNDYEDSQNTKIKNTKKTETKLPRKKNTDQ